MTQSLDKTPGPLDAFYIRWSPTLIQLAGLVWVAATVNSEVSHLAKEVESLKKAAYSSRDAEKDANAARAEIRALEKRIELLETTTKRR